MSRTLTAASIDEAFHARYAHASGDPVGGTLESLAASGEGQLESVQAAAVKGYSEATGKLRWVKATDNFTVALGQHVFTGDYVELKETIAKTLVSQGRAEVATDDEVAAASQPRKVAK